MITPSYNNQAKSAVCTQLRIAAFLLLATFTLTTQAEQYALLIGVADYKDERIPDLEGPANDVQALSEVLRSQWNFKSDNVRTLLNNQATETNILTALDELAQTTLPGDDILVYFSGHGTSARDPQLGAMLNLPDGSGAIVTSDFNPELAAGNSNGQSANDGMLVGRNELRPRFEALDQQRNILVVFDTCFSGNAARNQFSTRPSHKVRNLALLNYRNKAMPAELTAHPTLKTRGCSDCIENLSEEFNYKNLVYFGAAAENQLAVDFSQAEIEAGLVTTIDGKPHGGFTDSLLRVLSNNQTNQPSMSYGKLFNLLLNQFNEHCSHCGHSPVSLPILNDDTLQLLQRPFMPGRIQSSDVNPATQQRRTTDSTEDSDVRLGIVLPATTGENTKAPLTLRGVEELYDIKTNTPDISFSLQQNTLLAHAADGQLIKKFDGDVLNTEIHRWLRAMQWLKQRQRIDARNNNGQLSVEFRHPLLGNTVYAGDHVFFNLHSETDASIVILVMNSTGQLSILYPTNLTEANKLIAAGARVRLPGTNEPAIKVTPPWGTDIVLFYALPVGHAALLRLQTLSNKSTIDFSAPELVAFESSLNSGKVEYGSGAIRIVSVGSP